MDAMRLLILAAFTAGVLADPDYNRPTGSLSQCANTCPQTGGKLSYRPGQTYEYRYDADIQTNIPGSRDQSNLHMSASVLLDVVSNCDMSLRVTSVMLQDSDTPNGDVKQYVEKYQQFKQALENKPLRFGFVDGKIENICPSVDEEIWVLNIKRGILSTFQNTMTSLQGVAESEEIDVTGACPTKYSVMESQSVLKLRKSKNLIRCRDRTSTQSILQGVAYETESEIQSAPLLKGTLTCEQEIDAQSKIFKKIDCVEKHVFRPFQKESSGATTLIKYRVVFVRNINDPQNHYASIGPNRLPLLFDHSLSGPEMESNLRQAQQSIQTLCRLTQPDVRPEAPGAFSQLVQKMRGLDKNSLRQLQSSSQAACPKAMQFFRDAIAHVGSPASISIIADLIRNNQVSSHEADLLLTSISFIHSPSRDLLRELQSLLQSQIAKASLPVSSVVYAYLKLNPGGSPEVTAILKIFEDQLRYNCRSSSSEDKIKMLLALRAIGNAGGAASLAPTLDRCALNDQAPMVVRVAATQAYRRMPCSVSRNQMYVIYSNKELDAELRINAYLALMQCADVTVISRIHGLLNDEVVNQVGSFVWTHLTNLAETSNPLKADIREIITDPKLLKEFDIDKRKYSRNVEFSTFSNYLNMGGSVESNLIMSSQSYIPRSASFNLTAELFGRSFNFLDFGVRGQGFEELLEKHFGPGEELMKRDRRAVVNDQVIQTIDRQYSVSRDTMELSYYLRIFGNEIKSGDINDFNLDSVKQGFDPRQILEKLAQQRSVDLTRSYAFLDTSLTVPTGLGMPVRLGVEGTITVGLTASGKVDIRRMLSNPSDFDVTGSIRPSTAVEIKGDFGLDAHVTQTKLRLVNRLHSSLLIDASATLRNGQVFKFDWNMPQNKIEIFSAESRFYVTHRGQDREQKSPNQVEHKKCTSTEVAERIGLELCGEVSYPTSQGQVIISPMSGPSAVKIYLSKKDTFTSANIEASVIRNQASGVDTARFSFNTPGSRVDRELVADFRLDSNNKDFSLNLKSPWKRAVITGMLQSDPSLKKAVLKAIMDETTEYSVTAEVRSEQRSNAVKYVPNIVVVWPGRQPMTLEGQVTYMKGRRAQGSLSVKNVLREPITIDGSLQMVNRSKQIKYDVSLQFSSPMLRGSVIGYAANIADRTQTWSSRLDVNYQYQNGPKQRIVLNNKIRDTSSANLNSYSADGSWSTTMWPRYNGRFEFKKAYSVNSIRTTFDAGFDAVRKITIVQSGAYDFNGVDKKLNAEVKVELPYYRINYETKLNHINNWDMLQSNATVKYDENMEHKLDIGFKKDNQRYLNALAEAKLKLAGREPMMFTNTLIERAPRQYHNRLNAEVAGRSLSAIGLYKMGQRHELNADIQATGYEPISISAHLNPNLKNVQAKLDLKYGRRSYMTDVNWLYREGPGGFSARAGVEVGYLSKKYGLTGDLIKNNNNITASLQALCGLDRKVSITTRIHLSRQSPEFLTRVQWPQNFIEVVAAAKMPPPSRTQENEVMLKISTGFQNYEELGGNIKTEMSPDNVRLSGQVMWGRGKRISGDVSYGRSRADLNINTPFNGYRTIRANAAYSKRGTTYDITGTAECESSRMNIAGRMTHERGGGASVTNHGELTISGPWQRMREAKVTWRHQNDDGTFWKCHHEVEVDRRDKYIFDLDASSNRVSGRSQELKLQGTFTSPIQDWEHVALNWASNYDYQVIRAAGTGSVTWGRNTINLDHELNVQPNTFIAKALVRTPFRGYEVMGLDMNNRLDSRSRSYTLKNELSLGHPSSKLGLEGTLQYNGPTFNSGIRLTTPHQDYPRIAINLRNGRQQDGTWALHGDLEVRRGTSFTLDGKLGWAGRYGAELSLSSPYQSLRALTVKAMGSAPSAKQFEADLEVYHNLMQNKVKLATDVSVETMQNARMSLTLETPWDKLRVAKLGASHVYHTTERCLSTISYELNQYKGQFTHEQNVRSGYEFDGKTRLEYLEGQVISLEHGVALADFDRNGRGTITLKLSTPFNEARSVDATFGVSGRKDNFRSTIELLINRRDRINGNFEFSAVPQRGSLKYSTAFTTPYPKLRNFQASYVQSGSPFDHRGPDYDSEIEVAYQLNDKRWWSKRTFNVDREGAMKLNVKTQIPDSPNPSEFNVEYAPKNRNGERGWTSKGFLQVENVRYSGESEYIWRNEQQLTAKVVITTPSDEYNVMLNHRDTRGQVSTELTGKAGPHGTGSLSFSMNPSASNLQLTASLQTPYRHYERFDLSLRHEGPANNFKTVASLTTSIPEYRRFSAELTHSGAPENFNCVVKMETPFRALPSVTVRLNHKMTQTGLEASLHFEYAGKSISSTLNYNNDGRSITTTANLQTPYQGYESFSLNLEHTGSSYKNFRSSVRLTTPFTKLPQLILNLELTAERIEEVRVKGQLRVGAKEGSVTYNHNKNPSGDVTVNLEVVTPYSGYERSSLVVEHLDRSQKTKINIQFYDVTFTTEKTGSLSDLSIKSELREANSGPHTINYRHAYNNGAFVLSAETANPMHPDGRAKLAINHQPSGAGFKSTGKLDLYIPDMKTYGYEVDFRDLGREFVANIKLETPIRGYDKFEATVEHGWTGISSPRQSTDDFRTSVTLTTPIQGYRNFGLSLNHAGPASMFQTTARITTPFPQARQIDLTLKHQGDTWKEFKTSLDASYDGKKIDLETTFKYRESASDYAGGLKFNSPCPYLSNLELSASHNRRTQLKSGALMVKLNGDKKVDFDYSYTTEGARNVVINLRDPYQMGTNVRVGDSTGTATVDWDKTDASKKIRFDFGFKDIKSETESERLLSFKTSIPNSRTVGFLFGYKCSPGKFSNRGELYWDRDYSPDFTYELEGSKSESYRMNSYDAKLKVTSELLNFDTQLTHKSQPGRKHETELMAGGKSGRLTLKSDVTVRSETDYVHTLTIQHPRLTQDANIVTEVTNGNKFRSTFNFDRQTATLEGQYTNESRGPNEARYSSMIRLQHPNSMTDIKLSGQVYSDDYKLGGSLGSEYMTVRDRQIKSATLKAEIDRIKKELSVEFLTPLEDFKLKTNNRGVESYDEGLYRYDVIASIGRHDYKYSLDLSSRDRSVDVKLYDNNDFIQIFAQFYSPLQSQLDISRTLQGRKHNDAQLALAMHDDRLIKGRAYVRPHIAQDLSRYVQDLDRYPPAIVRNLIQSSDRLKRAIDEEWQQKKRLLEDSLRNIIQVVESAKSEVKQAYESLRSAFNAAYYRNDFYLKDIHQALKRHYEDLSREVALKSEDIRRKWELVSDKARQANRVVVEKWNEMSEALARKSADLKYGLEKSLQDTGRYFDDVSSDMRSKLLQHIHTMENHPFYRDYALMKPSDFLLPPDQWMDKLKSNFNRVLAKIEADIDQLVANNRPQIEQIKQRLFRYLQQNQEVFRRLGLESQLRDYMYKMQVMTWPQLKQQIKQQISEYFQWQRTKWTVWDPQRGEYAFEAYVPFDIPDLSTVQKLYNIDVLPSSYLPKVYIPEDWTIMDLIYAYRPVSDVNDWVPPFKGHATVVGNQHYMTFDRKFYEFTGECSYLLARDFIGKTFSVVVNYERTAGRPVKKSISVLSDGKQLEVSTAGRLSVDGRRAEMPVRVGNTTVSRQGNAVVIDNQLGLSVVCDLPHDHCTVSVSGWYYGKTAGLFGTYDNEAFNDLMTPDKSMKERAEDMASEWSVGARCRPTNHAVIITPDPSSRRYKACAELFEDDTSSMRSCFKRVSPKPFMDMCLNDGASASNSLVAQGDVCNTAAAYWHACRRVEVHLPIPANCVQCQVPNNALEKFYEGETKTLKDGSVPKSADVVFVIQHAPCSNAVLSKIRESVDDMIKAFTASGLRDIRFAVVGYGGSDHLFSAHVHTMDGQIFSEASHLSSALHGFSTVLMPSAQEPDAMGALAYAAKLPFRAGVSKSLILVSCDGCQELSVRYSDVQRVLMQSDVRLHVLSPQRIELKSRSPKTSLIFGVDDETVFTGKDVSDDELTGEPDLRKYVRLPKDLCVALTHSTDGSVFSAPQWTQSPASLQKKFTDVFARAVARKAKPSDCQQCECVADSMGAGVPQCSSCYQKNPIFSLLPNFYDDDYSDEIAGDSNRSRKDDDDDDDDDDTPQRNNSPQRRPKAKPDRAQRPPRPQQRPRTDPRPQRIPTPGGRPEVRDM